VSNPNQVGVKIGMTKKSIRQRLKSLNGNTAVAGKFEPVAIFPSDKPEADEKRVHKKVERQTIAKEHYDLEPVEATLKAYRALNYRRPIFFDRETEETFDLRVEEDRIKMKLKLKGKAGS
jgi:hypothetical protein